jgi:hypothetical protein
MKNNLHTIDVQKAEKAGIRFYSFGEQLDLVYLKETLKRTDEVKS